MTALLRQVAFLTEQIQVIMYVLKLMCLAFIPIFGHVVALALAQDSSEYVMHQQIHVKQYLASKRASAGRLVFVRMAFARALSRLTGLFVMAARASVQKESALQTATQAIRHRLGLLSLQVNHQPPCLSRLAHPNLP